MKTLLAILLAAGLLPVSAQVTNSWTKPGSGNWEDQTAWSLGSLPGPNQSILFTNAGWKALSIGLNTAQNFPGSMNVGAITVSSPQDSYNVLLLDYAGYDTPLRAGAITVDTNAVLTVVGSMLSVTNSGTTNDELLVGGAVNQGDNSAVRATYLYLGPNHPNLAEVGVGTYNLTNGLLNVSTGYMKVSGTINQYGGYSWFDQLTVYIGGYYYLYDGDFGGNVLIDGGNFYQFGGLFNGGSIMEGFYTLAGGMFISTGGLAIPPANALVAYFAQSGGTNQSPSLNVGTPGAWVGSYTMSGGTLDTPFITLDYNGFFEHTGGTILHNQKVTFASGRWEAKQGSTQLGQLELSGTTRVPILSMPSNACNFGFAPSASVSWQSGATMRIQNWAGSLSGGGQHQITFGPNGLTAQQVQQIYFDNPAGLPSATYPARLLNTGELVPDAGTTVTSTNVNNWINPSSAKWEDSPSWSLGAPPASNETVNITNAGYKAVNIDSTTVSGSPNALTVSNLTVGAPTNGLSTLLLNYFGLSTPLKVLNSCLISNNGDVQNLAGSFEVDGTNGGALTIDGGRFEQVGGQTVVNAPVNVRSGFLRATNANLTLGQMTLGTNQEWGYVQQDGGSIASALVNVLRGSYSLASGILYALQGTQLNPDVAAFYQSGGTNYGNITLFENSTYQLLGGMAQGNVLSVSESINHFTFEQDNGLLQMQFIDVTGGSNYTGFPCFEVYNGIVRCGTLNIGGNGTFGQAGGQVVLSNNLDMHGEFFITSRGNITEHSDYLLNSGQLQAPSISLGQFATFRQYGGSVALPGGLNLTLPSALYHLDGGTLVTTYSGVSGDFQQTGGHHEVDGVLSLVGSYELQGGALTVQGLYTRGALSLVGSGAFTNTGLVNLGGSISTSASNAVMGQIQLATNTTFGFSGFPARVYCSSSSGVSWTAGALLTITNWSNTRDGHMYFGTNASGLTASQLAQIQFSNPGGFAAGNYPAQLLSTGELVPIPRPTLQSSRVGSGLVMTWTGNYQLLSATNLAGPYTPVSGASSPWTKHFTKPQEFFILQGR